MNQNPAIFNFFINLIGTGTLLLIIGFFLKKWISEIEKTLAEQKDSTQVEINRLRVFTDNSLNVLEQDLKNYQKEYKQDVMEITRDLGRRKGEIELLKQDVQSLRNENKLHFEKMDLKLDYIAQGIKTMRND